MINKVEWLERCPLELPCFCLCLTEKQYIAALDHLKVPVNQRSDFTNKNKGATNHTWEYAGRITCIVCLADYKERMIDEISGLLTHEAVHIWQEYKVNIGELTPSVEFEAMSIQWLSQMLFRSFLDQTKHSRK